MNEHLTDLQKALLFAPKTSLQGPDMAGNKAILETKLFTACWECLGPRQTGHSHLWGSLPSALASPGCLSLCLPPVLASDKPEGCVSWGQGEDMPSLARAVRKACSACSLRWTERFLLWPALCVAFSRIAGCHLQNVLTCREGVAAGRQPALRDLGEAEEGDVTWYTGMGTGLAFLNLCSDFRPSLAATGGVQVKSCPYREGAPSHEQARADLEDGDEGPAGPGFLETNFSVLFKSGTLKRYRAPGSLGGFVRTQAAGLPLRVSDPAGLRGKRTPAFLGSSQAMHTWRTTDVTPCRPEVLLRGMGVGRGLGS